MYPIAGKPVLQSVTIQSYVDNKRESFEFHFTMLNENCANPKISFVVQETDFDTGSKYLDVIDVTDGYTTAMFNRY